MTTIDTEQQRSHNLQRLYSAAWRWHFYAGLFVIPFLIMLAITGSIMMITAAFSNNLGNVGNVHIASERLDPTQLASIALETIPQGALDQYLAPEAADRPAFFIILDHAANADNPPAIAVAVNPYTGQVIASHDKTSTLYALADNIHGSLLLGDFGDRLIETAASLTLIIVFTGLYMWWQKHDGRFRSLFPNLSKKGRGFWKELHVSVGLWVSFGLTLFLLSGLAWSGVWGSKMVQAWSSFPAEKYSSAWSSDVTHASMNHGPLNEVPWGLEQTPMPISGTSEGTEAVNPTLVNLNTVDAYAQEIGFVSQYKINFPRGDSGVYTISREAMNESNINPRQDLTLHIDQYTGNLLAKIGYADYGVVAKMMAWGIGVHMGLAGTWNVILNSLILISVLTVCISGMVMWWKRRPQNAWRLVAPPKPTEIPYSLGALAIFMALSLVFPMAGIAIIVVLFLDWIIISNIPVFKKLLS